MDGRGRRGSSDVSRRHVLAGLLAAAGALGTQNVPQPAVAQPSTKPDPSTLRPGDLLWPKPRGGVVPYDAGSASNRLASRALWEQERAKYVEAVRADRRRWELEGRAADALLTLTFEDFERLYLADQPPGTVDPYFSIGRYYVGHVGIVFFNGREPWVVESIRPKIRKISYEDWIKQPDYDDVWHGRLKHPERHRIADAAQKYYCGGYDFFNINLNSHDGFYCSKLVWLATWRELKFPLDNNPQPYRWPWYSPKQLMQSPHVCLLFSPGPYAERATLCPPAALSPAPGGGPATPVSPCRD